MRLGMHIAQGLAAAHCCNVLHLDLKPDNCLLDDNNDLVRAL